MRTVILILLLPLFSVAQTYDGFSLENGDLVWSGEYRYEGDNVRDALLAHLGTADGMQLANYQPQDKLVGKGDVKQATTVKSMMLTGGSASYSFGFIVTPVAGGYNVRLSNIYLNSGTMKIPLNRATPNEAALARSAQKGRLKEMSAMFQGWFALE